MNEKEKQMSAIMFVSQSDLEVVNVESVDRGRGTLSMELAIKAVKKDENDQWVWQLPDETRNAIRAKIESAKINVKTLTKGLQSVKVAGESDGKGKFYAIPDGVEFKQKTREDGAIVPVFSADVAEVKAEGTIGLNRMFQCGRGRSPSYAKAWNVEKDPNGIWQWINPGKSGKDFASEGSVNGGPSVKDMLGQLIKQNQSLQAQVNDLAAKKK